jgi:hypothetical protein
MTSKDINFRPVAPDEQLSEPLLARLHGEWLGAAQDGLPGLAFIDPLRLRYLLGSLLVMDVVRNQYGQRRYRYRLIGTEIVSRRGKDRTGSWLHQHEETLFAEQAVIACDAAIEQRQPIYATLQRRLHKHYYPVTYLLLPVVDEVGVVERILTAQLYPADAPTVPYEVKGQTPQAKPGKAAKPPQAQVFDPAHLRGLLSKLGSR